MDLYKILGITKQATDSEVRNSYLKLAKIYHPDKYVNEIEKKQAEEKFKQINEVYYKIKEERMRINKASSTRNESKETFKRPMYKSAADTFERVNNNNFYSQTKNTTQTIYTEPKYKNRITISDSIYKRKDGTIIFLFRDYSTHQLDEEKLQKRTLFLIKDGIEYEYNIYINIDESELVNNEKYKEYIVEKIFDNDKLQKVSEKLYGYMGITQSKIFGGYSQTCNYKSLEILREKAALDEYKIKTNDGKIFGLRQVYRQNKNNEELNEYILNTYDLEKGTTSRVIKSNINLSRMDTNELYREIVVSKYLSKNTEYIGNPEQDYKLKQMNMSYTINKPIKKQKENNKFTKIDTKKDSIFIQKRTQNSSVNMFNIIINGNTYQIYSNIDINKLVSDEEYKKLAFEKVLNLKNIQSKSITSGSYIGDIVRDGNSYKVIEDKKISTNVTEYAKANSVVYRKKRDRILLRKIGERKDGKDIFIAGIFNEKTGLKESVQEGVEIDKMQRDLIYRETFLSKFGNTFNTIKEQDYGEVR